MKDTTRVAILSSVGSTIGLLLIALGLIPVALEYVHTEAEFRSKVERARAEARVIEHQVHQDPQLAGISLLGCYGFRTRVLGIRYDRTVTISVFGKVGKDDATVLRAVVSDMAPSFPLEWCLEDAVAASGTRHIGGRSS